MLGDNPGVMAMAIHSDEMNTVDPKNTMVYHVLPWSDHGICCALVAISRQEAICPPVAILPQCA